MTCSLATRCHVEPIFPGRGKQQDGRAMYSDSIVLVLDCETTTDEYQNLLFGSCGVWINQTLRNYYIFYADELPEADKRLIAQYAKEHGHTSMGRTEFIENVFFPRVFDEGAVCVGFNLPFDLSRLAVRATYSTKYMDGFSFILSTTNGRPRLAIKSLDSKRAFIGFMNTLRRKGDSKYRFNRGCFVDLKTACFALTNRPYRLEDAAKDFQCARQKTHPEGHGKVTLEYIEYNVNDVLTTHDLYEKVKERYKLYGLDKGLNKLYSPASIGKAYLEKMGVKPFLEKNPDFPKDVLGWTMMAYYGGRSEVRVRRQPVKVTYLDFTSMYPTTYALYKMDKFLKADKITCQDTTEETPQLLDAVTQDDVINPKFWPGMLTICQLKPDNDILPVRAKYGEDGVYTIGLNYIKSNGPSLWYTLPDLIGSKMLTGKTPAIKKAVTFSPYGMQKGLQGIEILPDIKVGRKDDFIKKLIEERIRLKKEMQSLTGDKKHQHDLAQNILKIIANSTSYGVYIEVNSRSAYDEPVRVYGSEAFETTASKIETTGRMFNPIMAVFLTAGARLILATAEKFVTTAGDKDSFVYCDTDSIFITPKYTSMVQDFFRPLNPYDMALDMFKVEEDDNHKPLEGVWFYGISAKRYVLYDQYGNDIKMRKHSTHGLGGLVGFDKD